MIAIGLTGKYCAGKTAVCDYLRSKSFEYRSLSDELRKILEKDGVPPTRENMIRKGNELREKSGNSFLAKLVAEGMQRDRNYIVDSLRNPEEIRELQRDQNFHLWSIEATEKSRFERILRRKREGDPKTLEDFRAFEARESASSNASGQQLDACAKMAEHAIENNGTLAELFEKIDSLLLQTPVDLRRPSWDEYFMNIAKEVAMRSNCVKRKVAAVIVRDKRIVSTGYNGTPRGVKNCNEGGCPRCNSFAKGGTQLDECLCSHAEENAIVQAAYHGIAINGGTIYTTYSPCLTCSKMIINAGLKKVVFNLDYPLGEKALKMLQEAGVETGKIIV
ncbi:tRNA-specific adenosine deaminase [uncultured archaeon]|nr:tRNA-specific adenosine deaminase [uncultured archaeon]